MIVRRSTVADPVQFEGNGLHTGVPVQVTIHPSTTGIAFRFGAERVAAQPQNVTDTTRCTRLGSIGTIEHIMSAFAGLGITDAEVELDAPELPAMDGSASLYVEGILAAGISHIGEEERPGLFRRIFFQEKEAKIAAAKGAGHWRYMYDAGMRWPGAQIFESEDIMQVYTEQVAPARTFGLSEEIPFIIQLGLAKGLDENSALILGTDGYQNHARFEDEPARHKVLDLIGDLYLSGIPICELNVSSEKSGHTANVKTAAMLWQAIHA